MTASGQSDDALRVACVQLNVQPSRDANLQTAEGLVRRAAAGGADLVVLPEKWNAYGSNEILQANAERLEDGPSVLALRAWAKELAVTIVGGSITESRAGRDRLSNTSVVVSPDGELAAIYRKIHMFDVEVGDRVYRESDLEEPGESGVVYRVGAWPVGAMVCYDVRFPELARALVGHGAELLTVPAAFTLHTGKDHWDLLLRARAVENLCYVAAAAQHGVDPGGRPTYGRSCIVDPWGVVVAQAADEDTVIWADLDPARVRAIRASLPVLANRQPEAYRRVGSGAPGESDR